VSPPDPSSAPVSGSAAPGAGRWDLPSVLLRKRERIWLYVLLFILTALTASWVGAAMQNDFDRNVPFQLADSITMWRSFWLHPARLLEGLPYSLTLLSILLAHEFGHYIACVFHQVDSSLPYFMPSPVLGTFGAFIRIRTPIYSRRALFDIGVAGPLAGFVFLLPALAVGLAFSKAIPGFAHETQGGFGVPLLQWLMERAIFPGVATGDICLHPVARAAWVGMFSTAMNLLPIGQLDGGHVVYSFFPERHRIVSRVVCLLLAPLGAFWWEWLAWAAVLLWLGRRHPAGKRSGSTRPRPARSGLGRPGHLHSVFRLQALRR
jgi:hypothetical protein